MAKKVKQKPGEAEQTNSDAADNVQVPQPEQPEQSRPSDESATEPAQTQGSAPESPVPVIPVTVEVDHHAHVISTSTVIHTANSDAADNVQVIGVVKVRIQYPENFTGNKRLKNGKVYEVSQATADILVAKGIAEIIE